MKDQKSAGMPEMHHHHYQRLAIMGTLSFIAMYVLMYSMVDSFSNVYSNFNQFYMAALMTAPMIVIEVLVMREMYSNRKYNALIVGIGVFVAVLSFGFIREQTAISDRQFLKSMIPHHAAAILMCEKTPLKDAELRELCGNIVSSQQSEIDQMKRKLSSLK